MTTFPNVLNQSGLGSTDWAGGAAPPATGFSGVSTITMQNGQTFVVEGNAAEVNRRRGIHAIAQTNPCWVAFNQPHIAISVVLNINNIVHVA